MSEPFLAEIRLMGFNFAPRGWAFCDGQILPINQNQSLYSLLGTTYGGDGRTSFGLPDCRGRTPVHVGGNHPLGQKGGEETHTLDTNEMPGHDHRLMASSNDGSTVNPTGEVLAKATVATYVDPAQLVTMNSGSIGRVGGSQAHDNMQPYLAINFCIALAGLFPSRH
ncbi:MAG: tail fiber protein [Thermoanaerobaculia bacterium]|nr:tail fiber protein [Thermoanaerobaculia bacterium]